MNRTKFDQMIAAAITAIEGQQSADRAAMSKICCTMRESNRVRLHRQQPGRGPVTVSLERGAAVCTVAVDGGLFLVLPPNSSQPKQCPNEDSALAAVARLVAEAVAAERVDEAA